MKTVNTRQTLSPKKKTSTSKRISLPASQDVTEGKENDLHSNTTNLNFFDEDEKLSFSQKVAVRHFSSNDQNAAQEKPKSALKTNIQKSTAELEKEKADQLNVSVFPENSYRDNVFEMVRQSPESDDSCVSRPQNEQDVTLITNAPIEEPQMDMELTGIITPEMEQPEDITMNVTADLDKIQAVSAVPAPNLRTLAISPFRSSPRSSSPFRSGSSPSRLNTPSIASFLQRKIAEEPMTGDVGQMISRNLSDTINQTMDMDLSGVYSRYDRTIDTPPRQTRGDLAVPTLTQFCLMDDDLNASGGEINRIEGIPTLSSMAINEDTELTSDMTAFSRKVRNSIGLISAKRFKQDESMDMDISMNYSTPTKSGNLITFDASPPRSITKNQSFNTINIPSSLDIDLGDVTSKFPSESTINVNYTAQGGDMIERIINASVASITDSPARSPGRNGSLLNTSHVPFTSELNTPPRSASFSESISSPNEVDDMTANILNRIAQRVVPQNLDSSDESLSQDMSMMVSAASSDKDLPPITFEEFLSMTDVVFLTDQSTNRKPSLGSRLSLTNQPKSISDTLGRAVVVVPVLQNYQYVYEELQAISASTKDNVSQLEADISKNNPQYFRFIRERTEGLQKAKTEMKRLKSRCMEEAKATWYNGRARQILELDEELNGILESLQTDSERIERYNGSSLVLLEEIVRNKSTINEKSIVKKAEGPSEVEKTSQVWMSEETMDLLRQIDLVSIHRFDGSDILLLLDDTFELSLTLGDYVLGEKRRFFSNKSYSLRPNAIHLGLLAAANLPSLLEGLRHTGQLSAVLTEVTFRIFRITTLMKEIHRLGRRFPIRAAAERKDIYFNSYAIDVEFSEPSTMSKFVLTFTLSYGYPFSHLLCTYRRITGDNTMDEERVREIIQLETNRNGYGLLTRVCNSVAEGMKK
ncbi:hypothetical protein PROFUN_12491 [Planoprotostelium fungivorum]|uniref:Spc7 kinetochore protein domain-containing protein n=1 Tax=Planoprotostelium fungivorum TaxID=1890364 RepID=A0A2P6N7A1_9EUKA|nr:hypothetical protein PROFUN_12491 [Planoprotostelium fungivorum]